MVSVSLDFAIFAGALNTRADIQTHMENTDSWIYYQRSNDITLDLLYVTMILYAAEVNKHTHINQKKGKFFVNKKNP